MKNNFKRLYLLTLLLTIVFSTSSSVLLTIYEYGIRNPKPDQLLKIANALGISINIFMDFDIEMAYASIKEVRPFHYSTACLLIIFMLLSVSRQSDK